MIQETETARRVRLLVSRELRVDLDRVTPAARFRHDLAADHIDVVGIIVDIEDELGFQFDDDAGIDAIVTVGDMITLTEAVTAAAPAVAA